MAEEEEDEGGPTAPFWMVTYADMVTLLLTFFVLIVAMSEMKVDKMMEVVGHFKGRLSVFQNSQPIPVVPQEEKTVEDDDEEKMEEEKKEEAEKVEELVDALEGQGLQDKVEIYYRDATMHIVITDSVMFASGNAALINTAKRVMTIVSNAVSDSTKSVTVIGHTDNIPIRNSQFPSNWELSAARAAAVVRFMLTQNDILSPERYQAIGKGEFVPVSSNATRAGRARNRRIELLISTEPWQNPITSPQEKKLLTQ